MPEKIYTSHIPPIPLVQTSLWSFLFNDDRHGADAADEPAYIDAASGRALARAQLRQLTLELAWGLRNELPKLGGPVLKRGDTIMIFSPNSLAYPLNIYGAIAAGLKSTLASSTFAFQDLAFQWTDSGAELIILHPALLQVALDMFKSFGLSPEEAKAKIVISSYGVTGEFPNTAGYTTTEDLLGKGALESEEKFEGEQSNETVLICYSSGTTGKPKGVETTHYNVTSNVLMTAAYHEYQKRGRDISLAVLPFFHLFGLATILVINYVLAVPVVIMERFDPVGFCRNIEQYKITYAIAVPPILLALARHPATDKFNLTSLKTLMSGAAPLSGELATAVRAKLASVGATVDILQGYGLTETSPIVHLVTPDFAETKIASVGRSIPNQEVRLVRNLDGDDAGDGPVADVDDGEPGEIWLRGPNIMKGYLNDAASTTASITADGWFKTGDVGTRDADGFYYIVDRKKELIKYKGFQVPPAELEAKLLQHPAIVDAAVIGVESVEEATELPRAYIVAAKRFETDAEKAAFAAEVQEWIQGQVAKHKYLRGGVVVIDAVPKSAAGKILRKELRERAKAEAQAKA